MLNLILNGLDAMRHVTTGPDRILTIRSWGDGRSVRVAVQDMGEGFAPEDTERIFDPGYTTKSDGLGMGLAISKSIVRAHGGTLKATLNAGGGATFEFSLPQIIER
jgi:C4-dicarboxylate-specific signal transduction histidine kinase